MGMKGKQDLLPFLSSLKLLFFKGSRPRWFFMVFFWQWQPVPPLSPHPQNRFLYTLFPQPVFAISTQMEVNRSVSKQVQTLLAFVAPRVPSLCPAFYNLLKS